MKARIWAASTPAADGALRASPSSSKGEGADIDPDTANRCSTGRSLSTPIMGLAWAHGSAPSMFLYYCCQKFKIALGRTRSCRWGRQALTRPEEHTSDLTSQMRTHNA